MTNKLLIVHHTPSPHTHEMITSTLHGGRGRSTPSLLVAATFACRSAARRAVLSGLG